MPTAARPGTRALISIRAASELSAALAGADIVDVKEPLQGPLGMASGEVLSEIASGLETAARDDVELSIALGELREWSAERPLVALPRRVKYVKLGLSGMQHVLDWQERWGRLRYRMSESTHAPLEWIAVAYADAEAAEAPPVREVLDVAIRSGCRGLLIDTFDKRSGSLCSHFRPAEIRAVVSEGQRAGLTIALAGRIAWNDVPELLAYRPDILGVRSLVCQAGDRGLAVDPASVDRFRAALRPPENEPEA